MKYNAGLIIIDIIGFSFASGFVSAPGFGL
jgi:hypothetical protein